MAARPTHVAAFIFVDGLLLIQRRSPDREFLPDGWDVIGGAIDPGESPEGALTREVREETGLLVTGPFRWITEEVFVMGGRGCLEIGAMVEVSMTRLDLEAGKASAFALTADTSSFAVDNESRGYGTHFRVTTATALLRRKEEGV